MKKLLLIILIILVFIITSGCDAGTFCNTEEGRQLYMQKKLDYMWEMGRITLEEKEQYERQMLYDADW